MKSLLLPRQMLLIVLLLALHFGVGGATVLAQSLTPNNNHISTEDRASTLVIGRVSDNPKRDYAALKAIIDFVVPKLHAVGITRGDVLVAPNNDYMVSYLRAGRVDWITETAGNALILAKRSGAKPLVRTARGGIDQYHSVIFKRKDFAIRNLSDLRGKSVAVQNPVSTSAYFLPVADIVAESNADLQFLATPFEKPNPQNIGIVFAQSEANIATWVQKGIVDAGAFSDGDWNDNGFVPMLYRADLEIIHHTQAVPRALEMVRADLPKAVEQALRLALLELQTDPAAQASLRKFFSTNGFSEFNDKSVAELSQLQRKLARLHERAQ